MARGNPSLRKYWPIMLMSLAMVERAHAPLVGNAAAAENNSRWAKPAAAVSHPLVPGKTTSKTDMHAPPTTAPTNPATVEEKMKALEPVSADPWVGWTPEDPFGKTGPNSKTPSASLLPSDNSDTWGDINPGPGNFHISPPTYLPTPAPSQIVIDGGTQFSPNVAPVEPTPHRYTVNTEVAVPEPAMIPVLLGTMLLGRRTPRKR